MTETLAGDTGQRRPAAVVVAGASAGGVEALRAFVAGLPAYLDAAVLIVLHIPRSSPSALPAILRRSGPLPADHAEHGSRLLPGRIYVAPADHHLLVMDGHARLSRGPTENGHRPAIDPLFRSAARAYGERVVALVLSGSRDDGTAGLAAVAARGGTAFVQHPDDALHAPMPRSALDHVQSARALPATALGAAVAEAVALLAKDDRWQPATPVNDLLAMETAMANMEDLTTEDIGVPPSGLACPACHGALFEFPAEPTPRYRCRIGHAWSPDSLLDEHAEALEGALWIALRALEEKASLSQRMASAARARGSDTAAGRYEVAGAEATAAGRLIRDLIGKAGRLGDLEPQQEPA